VSHARQQIREAFAAQITGLASSAPVYQWRVHLIPIDVDLSIRVSTPDEDMQQDDALGVEHERTLTIRVELFVKASTDVDDVIDTLCLEVEHAIAADTTLGGLVYWCVPLSFTADTDASVELDSMMASMDFQTRYRVSNAAVDTTL